MALADGTVKKVFKLENALGRVSIFIGGNARDGRFVHLDILGHVAQDHRFEMGNAFFEEGPLIPQDTVHHFVDRLLTLMDTLDQPGRRPHFLLDVIGGLPR